MELIHKHKNFWEINNYPYIKVVEISGEELLDLLPKLSRTDIIEWLKWNDRNGVYSDEASIREFGQVMTMEEGIEIMTRQADENRVIKHLKAL